MNKNKIIKVFIIMLSILFLFTGCGDKKSSKNIANNKKIIKIGVSQSLTGEYSEMGIQGALAVRYANEMNHTININGEEYEIVLVEVDNESTKQGGINSAKKLLNENVSFVISGFNTDSIEGIIEQLENNNMPIFICTNTNIDLTNGRNNIYRMCPDDTFVAASIANYIKNSGDNNVCIICDETKDFCKSIMKYFETACNNLQLNIISREFINNKNDIAGVIGNIKKNVPDNIYLLTSRDIITDVVKKLRENEINSNIESLDIWEYKNVINEASNSANGLSFLSFYDNDNGITNKTYEFINGKGNDKGFGNYLKVNGFDRYVYPEAAFAYDTYMLIYDAISKTNTINKMDIIKNIDNITYEGLTGIITFDELGNVKKDIGYIKTINDLKVEYKEKISIDGIE